MKKLGRPKGSKEKWNLGSRKNKSVEDRFWEKVSIKDTDDCWEWQANIIYGYGMFTLNKKQVRAHQWSWKYFYGEIPEGLCVLHTCDNRICVNPNHLFLGTHKDNAVDRQNKGRTKIPHIFGENHKLAKLNDDLVRQIRFLRTQNMSYVEIANAIGSIVDYRTVGKVISGRSWKHVK